MRKLIPLSALATTLLSASFALAGGADTCATPTAISALPYSDMGDTSGLTNDISIIPVTCNGKYATVEGPDVVYSVVVQSPPNSLTFTVTSTGLLDPSIYLLSTCTDGNSCAAGFGADNTLYGDVETFTVTNIPAGTYFFYVDSFYASTDPYGQGTYTLDVTGSLGMPAAAPVANNGTLTTAEDMAGTTTLDATDANGDTLTYMIAMQPPAAEGTVTLVGNMATFTPAPNFNGMSSFTFTATDPGMLVSNTATVSVMVTPVNDPPTAMSQMQSTMEDTPVDVTLMGADIDAGDMLTYAIATMPPATEGTVSVMGNVATFTPAANFNGTSSFTYHVTDMANAMSSEATVTIDVVAVNDAPFADDNGASTLEDTPVDITLTGGDVDMGDMITFELTQQPPAAEGMVTLMGAVATFTPGLNFNGQTSFKFRTLDSSMTPSMDATVTVMVGAIDDPPTFVMPTPDDKSTISVEAGQTLSFVVTATDPDSTPTYGVKNAPAAAKFDMATGAFDWTTTTADLGTVAIQIEASDAMSTITRDITLQVTEPMGSGGAGGRNMGGMGGMGMGGMGMGGMGMGGSSSSSSSSSGMGGMGEGGGGGAGGGTGGTDETCSCNVVGAESRTASSGLLLGLLALLGLRRRKN